ncbi:MAG: hypothetical protein R2791_11670 [Saprospiraceae bacterium]
MRNIILPSGRFFKPYSTYKDNHSLACYYTRIYRERNGEKEYPLSVILSDGSLSIYWHGYQQRINLEINWKEDYGVHQIFSFDFTEHHKESFERWLSQQKLMPAEFIHDKAYKVETQSISQLVTYSDLFFGSTCSEEDIKLHIFNVFILDFLFDIRHSNLFISHPRFENLIGFLISVPVIKGIWYKYGYLYAFHEYSLGVEGSQVERNRLIKDNLQENGKTWLFLLRSKDMEPYINTNKHWFDGVEIEHDKIYKNSKSDYLRIEAEDSVQWSLGRYDLIGTYRLQFTRVFSSLSRWLILGVFVLSFILSFYFLFSNLFYKANILDIGKYDVFYVLLFCFLVLILIRFVSPKTSAFIIITCTIMFFSIKYGKYHFLFIYMFFLSIITLNLLIAIIVERIIHAIIRPLWNLLSFKIKKGKYQWEPNRSFYDSLLSVPKIISIIKPKILLASSIVWTFLFASKISFLWSTNFKVNYKVSIVMCLVIISAYFFMMAKLSTVVIRPKGASKFIELTKRGVLVLILASTYSFIIGMIGMSFAPKDIRNFSKETSHNKTDSISRATSFDWRYPVSFNIDSTTIVKANKGTPLNNEQLEYKHNFNIPFDDNFTVSINLYANTNPLIFFTFITVAVGILLEMGLRIEDTGINLD